MLFLNSSAVPVNDKWTAITTIRIWAFTGVGILSLAVHQGKITHCCSISLIILTFEIEFSTISPKTWITHEVDQRSSACWINFNLFFLQQFIPPSDVSSFLLEVKSSFTLIMSKWLYIRDFAAAGETMKILSFSQNMLLVGARHMTSPNVFEYFWMNQWTVIIVMCVECPKLV